VGSCESVGAVVSLADSVGSWLTDGGGMVAGAPVGGGVEREGGALGGVVPPGFWFARTPANPTTATTASTTRPPPTASRGSTLMRRCGVGVATAVAAVRRSPQYLQKVRVVSLGVPQRGHGGIDAS
jgi:hypothetical protein